MVSCTTDQGNYISPGRDKRTESRAHIQALPVKITGECARLYGYSRNISASGMQIRAFALCPDWPKPVGERISIEFEMPDKGVDFCCKCEIVWKTVPPDGPSSMVLQGIKFVDIEPDAQRRINSWLKGFRA
jgi:hypothetical protein